ncbi:MAG: ROK family protein [Bacteroidales bacterium]|nr:ROK family protein [Candidatus Scybalocola fimicaballi]
MMTDMVKPYVVGIDVGGTNTAFGIVDANGKVLANSSIKTQQFGADLDAYINELHSALSKLIAENGGIEKIKGIGVGAPNANYYTGNIENAANLPWKGTVEFAKLLTNKFGVPCTLTNDANAATIGEMMYGAAKGMKDFIMITLGTGVGSGIVCNGKLVYGHDGNAGELGHVIVRRGGRQCGCGQKGCLETYTSATGIIRSAQELLQASNEPSPLRNIPLDKITGLDVCNAARQGDRIGKEVMKSVGTILGEAFADFVKFSSPEAIVMFGGPVKSADLFIDDLKATMEANLPLTFRGKVKVLTSQLKDGDAAILGASALAW